MKEKENSGSGQGTKDDTSKSGKGSAPKADPKKKADKGKSSK